MVLRHQKPALAHLLARARRDVDALACQHERLQLEHHLQRRRVPKVLLHTRRILFGKMIANLVGA